MPKPTQYLTLKQALERLADQGLTVSDETVRRWARSGRLPSIRTPGLQRRYRIEDIDALLDPAEVGGAA
jgi:excisionase family DNA binding protein